jgi:hypothetical protein
MKLVKCGKCGTQFDATAMKPGSKFPCGKCRTPVQVPAAAPAAQPVAAAPPPRPAVPVATSPQPRTQPRLPPAMQARAQTTPTARAAGAAPTPAPATVEAPPAPAAPRAARPRRDPAAPGGKPPVALIAGIAGGVIILGAGAWALSSRGAEKPKDTAAAPPAQAPQVPAPAPAPAPAPKPKDPNVPEEFAAMGVPEQHDALEKRFVLAEKNLGDLEKLQKWLDDPKVKDSAEAKSYRNRVLEAALKLDAECGWAHSARGDQRYGPMLQKCKDECKTAFEYPDKPEQEVISKLADSEGKPWCDAVEYDRLKRLVGDISAREQKMTSDPRFKEAEHKRDWVRRNPVFASVELTWNWSDPYVIFQEVKSWDPHDVKKVKDENQPSGFREEFGPKIDPGRVRQNEEWRRKGELFAQRDGIIFTELNRRFRELWAERFKLPTLQEKGRILTGIVMWNRASFDKLLIEAKQPVSPLIRAFYSPMEQKFYHYLGDDSLTNQDEIWCAQNRVQKKSDQVTFHEGTHQLQHEYAAIHQGKPLKDDEIVFAPRKAMWFEEGLAEFMGAVEVDRDKTEFLKDVQWFHNRILLERVAQSRGDESTRELSRRWRIKELLKPDDNGSLLDLGGKLGQGGPDKATGDGGWMANLFYSRAWGLCHFLWYYDNGKYREKFNDYLGLVLKGTQSSDKFAKQIMGRPNSSDWGQIETEFEWYWDQLLRARSGLKPGTQKRFEPETEAPTGNVAGDTDWLEVWNENHKKDEKPK